MRLSEITGLRWQQVDLKEGMVRLAQADTKTGKSRIVPLPSGAVEALEAWPRRLDGRVFEPGWTAGNVSPQFTRLCRKVGVEDLRLHDLRHTAATRLRRGGVDVVTIGAILGHRTLDMVKRYQTIDAADLKEAVARASGPKGRKR